MGDLSLNFSRYEFLCKHCKTAPKIDERLVDVLQAVRTAVGLPLQVVSGYRCRAHNSAVGGSRASQHLQARAADIRASYPASVALWQDAGATGVGVRAGEVVHVDTRRDVGFLVFPD